MLEVVPLWLSCTWFIRENWADVDGFVILHSDGLTWDFCLDIFTMSLVVPEAHQQFQVI